MRPVWLKQLKCGPDFLQIAGERHWTGDTSPDAVFSDSSVLLRPERASNGNGRVYKVYFSVTEDYGKTCSGVVQIGVPVTIDATPINDG